MNSNPAAKSLCPEIHTLLKLYMTVPVTSATAERTFSMRRITTYYYDPGKAESFIFIFIHADKSRVDNLDLTQIAKLFNSVNERGAFFGKM